MIYRDTCARNIVFRDTMRRQQSELKRQSEASERDNRTSRSPSPSGSIGSKSNHDNGGSMPSTPTTHGDSGIISIDSPSSSSTAEMHLITALPSLDLSSRDIFEPLLSSDIARKYEHHLHFTEQERHVIHLFEQQRAVVKTIRHGDLADFLDRFKRSSLSDACKSCGLGRGESFGSFCSSINSSSEKEEEILECDCTPSFRTSTSLLPPSGNKMRPYGSPTEFSSGVVFALPEYDGSKNSLKEKEDQDVVESNTWVWPCGYSAKTEFNIDSRGNLINGRHEAQVSISMLRSFNGKKY